MKMVHNNQCGSEPTPLQATWHPTREDVFFIGSTKEPHRVIYYIISYCFFNNFLETEKFDRYWILTSEFLLIQ